MPQYDLYHNQVKNALTKDGWIITDDPFLLEYKGLRLYAGQYNIYVSLIKRINPDRKLYLAIPEAAYQDFFLKPAIQDILSDQQQINYIIFDPNQEVIVQWIS